jgi:hypothetical protein
MTSNKTPGRASATVFLCLGAWLSLAPLASAQSGSISASPNPCTIYYTQTLCTSTISWSSSGTTQVQVWVSLNGGTQSEFAATGSGSGYFQAAPWIQPDTYVFYLYNYSSGSRGALLASVTVTAITSIVCPP